MSALIAVLAYLLALGPLIIFHELGHFTVARLCGVKVIRFSIGFGKPLLKFVRGKDGVEWTLSAIPLGGYVAMLDEQELPENAHYSEEELKRAFNRQNVWKRIAIVVAGPVANFILAIVLFWALGLHGVEEPRAILAEPALHSVAEFAGVKEGDEVEAVDDRRVRSYNDMHWELLKAALAHRDVTLHVRNVDGVLIDRRLDLALVPTELDHDPLATLGIQIDMPRAVLAGVTAGGVAELAGLRAGDVIVGINGKRVAHQNELVAIVNASPNKPLLVDYLRAGVHATLTMTPHLGVDPADPRRSVGLVGMIVAGELPSTIVQYGPIESASRSVRQTWEMTTLSLAMIGKMVSGEVSVKNLSGPVTIADYAGKTARQGWVAFISFIAFVSGSIGLMNLLPIPMLDGGHLLYYFAEIIKGRPLSERFLGWSQRVGMALLAGLMTVALFNDFSRLLF